MLRLSISRPRIAQLFLILAFPLWFPRMIFWMMLEFFRVQLREWLPPPAADLSHPGLPYSQPALAVIPGYKSREDERYRIKVRSRTANSGLRVIQGGNYGYTERRPVHKKAI